MTTLRPHLSVAVFCIILCLCLFEATFFIKVACAFSQDAPYRQDTDGLSFLQPTDAQPDRPLFRILYTASTKGELYPCPTWQGALYGGLARRASVFATSDHVPYPTLRIAGPDEFLPDASPALVGQLPPPSTGVLAPYGQGVSSPSRPVTQKLTVAAYNALHFTAGYLSSQAADWFKEARVQPPKNFHLVTNTPVSITLPAGNITVGIVFFPPGKQNRNEPDANQIQGCLQAGQALKKKTQFIIGVSPWGLMAEKAFLPKAEGIFDCLLGGGDGVGFSHSVTQNAPGILWIRSDARGRAVTLAEIYTLPSPGKMPHWIEKTTFSAKHIYLTDQIPFDPALQRILHTPL